MHTDDKGSLAFLIVLCVGLPLSLAFADWLTATPESVCKDACGERGVASVNENLCECRE